MVSSNLNYFYHSSLQISKRLWMEIFEFHLKKNEFIEYELFLVEFSSNIWMTLNENIRISFEKELFHRIWIVLNSVFFKNRNYFECKYPNFISKEEFHRIWILLSSLSSKTGMTLNVNIRISFEKQWFHRIWIVLKTVLFKYRNEFE